MNLPPETASGTCCSTLVTLANTLDRGLRSLHCGEIPELPSRAVHCPQPACMVTVVCHISHDPQNQPYGQWGTSRLAAQPGGQGMRTWSGRTGGVQVEGVDRGESNLAATQAANMKQTRSLPLDNYSAITEDRSTSIKYNACRHKVSRGPRLTEDTEYTCDCHLKPRVSTLTRGRDHNQCQWHRKTICAARQATLDRNGPRGPPRAAMQQGPRHVPGA